MNRRSLLKLLGVSLVAGAADSEAAKAAPSVERLQRDWKLLLAKNAPVARDTAPVTRSDDEWRNALPADSYRVPRHEGTERPFSSALNDEHRAGVFVCAGCALPLFTSDMKFDSGTGWPSFFTTIPNVFELKKDFYLMYPRTEYHCARCGGHHGHLFDDGPPPTGQRYCNNGVALKFIPKQTA